MYTVSDNEEHSLHTRLPDWLIHEGGVHVSKLAYEDLTWENSSDPESFAPWYTMIMGHYRATGVYI